MEPRLAERVMMVLMVIGFILSTGYALSSSHVHRNDPAPAKQVSSAS